MPYFDLTTALVARLGGSLKVSEMSRFCVRYVELLGGWVTGLEGFMTLRATYSETSILFGINLLP